MKVIGSIDDALGLVGHELGVSEWVQIDQARIAAFADVTGDRQWIHVDVERAAAESPYGTTIAHGFLTLSLIPMLAQQNYRIENVKLGLNYGMDKLRFLAPVPQGSRVRLRSELLDVTKINDTVFHLVIRNTVELDGSDKPAVVAEMIARIIF